LPAWKKSFGLLEPAVAGPPMKISWRLAGEADLELLGEWNHQLIRDEGHSNPMSAEELTERMRRWLQGEYEAVLFFTDEPVGYALYQKEEELVYLRQLFVRRDRRRRGIGRAAMETLKKEIWPEGLRFTVAILSCNTNAIRFYRSVGYQDYCLTMEILPE
jgi:GNAT superfamily N-acetyltransferase